MATDPIEAHAGGGFNPPEPTTAGGPDYGRFVEAVRTLQDHTRAADAPDEMITKVADMIETVNELLAPYEADEWTTPSGRRMDLPNRGNILQVPADLSTVEDEVDGVIDRISAVVREALACAEYSTSTERVPVPA